MTAHPGPMPETLARFPIRCTAHFGPTSARFYCDEPASLAVTATPECGCPPEDCTVCAKHADRFVFGYRRDRRKHVRCGKTVSYVITGRRPLNEGDLP